MSSVASGVRHLTGVRLIKAGGGLLSHALLCSYFGLEGYGVLGIALGILGLVRLVDLNTASALQTFVPLLLGEGAGKQARRLTLVAYAANVLAAVFSSAVLLFARQALSAGNPVLADALLGLAVWNLLPVLRGPVDPDLMLGLRWYRPLLLFRALEHGGAVLAAALVWGLGLAPAGYFLLLAALSLPTAGLSLVLLPQWRRVLSGGSRSAAGSLARLLRYSIPLTVSQALYRVYLNIGAPLVGALLSVPAAGLYRFALNIAEMTVDFLGVVPQAFHPALARARSRGREAVVRLYREAVDVTLTLAAPAALVLVVGSTWISVWLSRGKFESAAPLLEIIAFQVFLRVAASPAVRILFVYEKTLTVMALNAGKLVLELAALLVLVRPLGAGGAVSAHVLAALPASAAFFVAARRALGSGAGGVTFALGRVLGGLAAVSLGLAAAEHVLGPAPAVRLAVLGIVAAWTVHRITRRTRGAPAEALLRDQLFAGVPLLGRLAARPGAPVTFVTNSRAVGGVEGSLEDLARGLARRGLAFELVCPETPAIDSWVERMREAGAARVTRVGVAAPWDVAGMWRTFRTLRRTRGLLHFHQNSLDDLAPALHLAALAGRRPILTTLQLSRKDRPGPLTPKGIRRRFVLPVPDRILTVAEDLRRELIEVYGVEAERVVTVRNAVDPERFAPAPGERAAGRRRLDLPEDRFVLLFVGRLTRVKGVDVLLEALSRLEATERPELLVAGSGPLEAELVAEAGRQRVTARFLGWQHDVRPWLAAADALVLPSRYEGLPLVTAEAMAAGIPVIATAVCGTPEIVVDGETGLLVPPDDAPALAGAIERLVRMPAAARRAMGRAGQERVRSRFRVEHQVDAVLAEYARFGVAARTARPAPPAVADEIRSPEEVACHAGARG